MNKLFLLVVVCAASASAMNNSMRVLQDWAHDERMHVNEGWGYAHVCTAGVHHAAARGDYEGVCAWLSSPSYVNIQDDEGRTPLFFAACYGHEKIVQLLLNRGADVNLHAIDGLTPLRVATLHGRQQVVQLIKDHIVRPARQEILVFSVAQHGRAGAQSPAHDISQSVVERLSNGGRTAGTSLQKQTDIIRKI